MEDKNLETKGYLMIMFAAICWGLLGTFTKLLNGFHYDAMSISAYRPTIALIFYVILTLIQKPSDFKTDLRGLVLFCIFGLVAYNGLFIGFSHAVAHTTLATAVVLLYTAPIFIIILSHFLLGEAFTREKLMALFATALGCFLVVEGYKPGVLQVNMVGILWGLLSAVGFATQNVLGKIILKDYSHRTLLVYGFLFSALFLWLFRPPWTLFSPLPEVKPFLLILGIGVLSTIIPNGLQASALKYIEAGKAGIASNLEPVVAVILAFVIFDERLTLIQWFGIVLILFSLILLQYKRKNKTAIKVE